MQKYDSIVKNILIVIVQMIDELVDDDRIRI